MYHIIIFLNLYLWSRLQEAYCSALRAMVDVSSFGFRGQGDFMGVGFWTSRSNDSHDYVNWLIIGTFGIKIIRVIVARAFE